MIDGESSGLVEYERLHTAAVAALDSDRPQDALALLDRALEQARRVGDPELLDRAYCNRAAVAVSLGELEGALAELRRILMANSSQQNAYLAAIGIARIYELRKEPKKGLFYARLARDRAESLGRQEWLASAHNQAANHLAADSFFEEAAAKYREALRTLEGQHAVRYLVYQANLGYCEVVLGRLRSGFELLYRCLRTAGRKGLLRVEMIARIDLCFAHLESGHVRRAWRHGRRGLELAEQIGEVDWVKNALFLMGEVCAQGGQPEEAQGYFQQLQTRFYPGQPYLPAFLSAVDVRKLVNLRA